MGKVVKGDYPKVGGSVKVGKSEDSPLSLQDPVCIFLSLS